MTTRGTFRTDYGLMACALCESKSALRLSHIIPAFVYDWFKRTSVTKLIRTTHNATRPVQDGTKVYLLCEECEQRFGRWETGVRAARRLAHTLPCCPYCGTDPRRRS